MSDLSVTAASNSPSGSESPTNGDDFLRATQAILRTTNAKGIDIASATTTNIGAATGEFVDVTGTTTITGLGTIAAGIVRTVRFTGILTLTHNGTSLILPGAANISTVNGDVAMFRSLGSGNWVCVNYIRASGVSLGAQFTDSTFRVIGSSDATKKIAFEADDNISTNNTRTLKSQNKDGTIATIKDQIQQITASISANALTVTVNISALAFRSTGLSSGAVGEEPINSAISMTVSSGSTLGTISGVTSRIAVLAIYAATFEVAVVNIAGGNDLTETGFISTTAEGGAGGADSANVVYSATARSNLPYRVMGYIESTQATAGTWATGLSVIQGAGGQAFTAHSSIGYGQTYQDVTGSRAVATTYYNTTFKPIHVHARVITTTAAAVVITLTVNGVALLSDSITTASAFVHIQGIVPPGQSYALTVSTGTGTLSTWIELRT